MKTLQELKIIFSYNPDTGELEPYNGAAHAICNSRKSSVRINYNEVP